MATSEWDVYEELPAKPAARARTVDPWAEFEELPPEPKAAPASDLAVPWALPPDLAPAPGTPVPLAPPLHSFSGADLGALFGPREGPMQRVSLPSPHTVPEDAMQEIVVSATRKRDTRPPATWGDVASALPGTIADRFRMKGVGAQEMVASNDARAKYWQALILPDAYKQHVANKAAAGGEPFVGLAEDPLIADTAARLGMRVDQFIAPLYDILKMSPQELEAYKEENRARIESQAARREDLAGQRMELGRSLEAQRPNFESEWGAKALTFDLASSAPDLVASVGAGMVGGPAVGLGTLGGLTLPEQYATAGNLGLDDGKRAIFASAMTLAEVVPELKAMEILTRSPAGKRFLQEVIGNAARGKIGHVVGATGAEAGSEMITEALQIGIENGLIDADTSLSEGLERIARAGLLGGVMGGTIGGVTSLGHVTEPETAPIPEGGPDAQWAPFGAQMVRPGVADNLPAASTADFADILAGGKSQGFAAPFVPQQSDVQQPLPINRAPEHTISSLDIFPPPVQSTGSRAPEPVAASGSAPVAQTAQGTASQTTEAPLSTAFQQPAPAASPATPAPQEPAPAPAPAAPAVSTAQEPPAGEATVPDFDDHASRSLFRLENDEGAPVRRYADDPRGGGPSTNEKPPPWKDIGGGWQAREYNEEYKGQTYPRQEIREPGGRRHVRGYGIDGKPLVVSPDIGRKLDQTFEAAEPAPKPEPPATPEPDARRPKEELIDDAEVSLTKLKQDPEAHVRKSVNDPYPQWTPLGNGYAVREYVDEMGGQRIPVQQVIGENGRISSRTLDESGAVEEEHAEYDEDKHSQGYLVARAFSKIDQGAAKKPPGKVAPAEPAPAPPTAAKPESKKASPPKPAAPKAAAPKPQQASLFTEEGTPAPEAEAKPAKVEPPEPTSIETTNLELKNRKKNWQGVPDAQIEVKPVKGGFVVRHNVQTPTGGYASPYDTVFKTREEAIAHGAGKIRDYAEGAVNDSHQKGEANARKRVLNWLDQVAPETPAQAEARRAATQAARDEVMRLYGPQAEAQEEPAEEPAEPADEEMTDIDEDIGTTAAAEPEPEVDYGEEPQFDQDYDPGELSDRLQGKTGTVPKGPTLPGESGPVDPLQIIGARKAEDIARRIESTRQAEVAPKRDTTLGQSMYDSMWRDLHGGMHPGETPEEYAVRQEAFVQRMRNAPIKAQLAYAQRRLKTYFDFKDIKIDPKLNSREALDAMLDAYNNLHTQANIMGQPKEAMGFNGDLTLSLDKKIGNSPDTRGQFSWKFGQGFGASVLSLARRADSFTHEWLHALDLNLLMRFTKRRALGVSGASNLTMTPLPELPKKVHDAFMNVMRAILLTDEASMKKMAGLTLDAQQSQVALTKAREKARKTQGVYDNREAREKQAAQYEKEAETMKDPFLAAGRRRAAEQLRLGNKKAETQLAAQKAEVARLEQRLKDIDRDMKATLISKASALAQGSRFVDFMQGRPYFSLPAELFARAGESWMGNRIGQQRGVEFLAGSPEYYNRNTDALMSLVYPNEADRARIFSAFDDLFLALATDQYFAGNTVASRIPQNDRLEKELWLEAQRNAEVHAIRNALNATGGDIVALGQLFKRMASPISSAVAAAIGIKNTALEAAEAAKHFFYLFYTARGRLNGLVAKAKAAGNSRLAAKLRSVARKLTNDPGSGALQEESMEEEYMRQATADLNSLSQIAEQHGLDSNNEEQMRQLYEELAKPTAQVRAELEEYQEFLEGKLAETAGDRNKVRTAEALRFQIAAIKAKVQRFAKSDPPPGKILNAADKIRKLMDESYYRSQNAGIDMGYVSNYMFRTLDDAAINENRAKFVDQAQAVYDFELHRKARSLNKQLGKLEDELRVAKSVTRNLERGQPRVDEINRQMGALRAEIAELGNVDTLREAQNWLYSTQVADMFEFDRSTPPSNYTKARKLGPIADILMAEFYEQNPLSNLQQYFAMSARRAAYARRFGNDHAKYQQMRHELLAEGIDPADLQVVDEQVKVVAGTYNPGISKGLRSFTNFMYNTATMALLPFSLFAQLAEPVTAGIRTRDVRDSFKNVFYTLQQIFRAGNAAEMRQIADIIGLISSAGTDTIVQNRLFQDVNAKNAKVVNGFYKVTGVHGYTSASRVGTMKLGGKYLASWADTYLNSAAGSKERAAAEEEFRELGIPPGRQAEFARYVRMQGNMLSINQLLRPENAEVKQDYVVALHRFVDTIIGNPKPSDRARMSFNPVGRFVMSISSFNLYFQRHVLARFGKRLARSDNKTKEMIQFAMPFMALMVGTMASRLLREWLQDREKFEKRVEELATVKTFFNAIDASGGTGGFAPLYNWLFKSRYEKELSTIAMGAAMGFYVDSVQDIMEGFSDEQDPKDRSGAAERRAARSAYRLVVNSIAPRVLEAMGLRGPLGWAALTYSTSYNTADTFGSMTVPKTANEKMREAEAARRRAPTPASEARKQRKDDRKQERIEKKYGDKS